MTRPRIGRSRGGEAGERAPGEGEKAGRRVGGAAAGTPHRPADQAGSLRASEGGETARRRDGEFLADGSRASAATAASDAPDVAETPAAANPGLAVSPSRRLPLGATTPYASESLVRVRYVETDQMGLAHHSNYFAWFEIGRTDFIRALGTSYAQLERSGLLLAIAEASVRYLSGAHYDDLLVVHTRLTRVQSRSVTFEYEIVRREPEPPLRVAVATMKLIAIGADGATRTLPPEFRRRLEQAATRPGPVTQGG